MRNSSHPFGFARNDNPDESEWNNRFDSRPAPAQPAAAAERQTMEFTGDEDVACKARLWQGRRWYVSCPWNANLCYIEVLTGRCVGKLTAQEQRIVADFRALVGIPRPA